MMYSGLSLSQIPRDSLKYFEISVPRHIRFAKLRKKLEISEVEIMKVSCIYSLAKVRLMSIHNIHGCFCGKMVVRIPKH